MRAFAFLVLFVLVSGCTSDPTPSTSPSGSAAPTGPAASEGTFSLRSSAFQHMQPIPTKYTCDATAAPHPPLTFKGGGAKTLSYALIMEDPDAPSGTVLHWTFWNLPPDQGELAEGKSVKDFGGREGQAYRGPCPPVPPAHRYFFYGYAVDAKLELPDASSVAQLRTELEKHKVAEDQFYGTYTRVGVPLG